MKRPKCGTCPYWDHEEGEYWADCKRRGPTLEGDEYRGIWLQTHKESWCGEHPDFPAYIAATRSAPPSPGRIDECGRE